MQANIRDKVLVESPKTLAERQQVAREFAAQFKVSLPILADTIDDHVGTAYAAWPDRIYVIDAKGNIAYKGAPGPAGFRVEEVPPVLDRLLSGAAPQETPPSAVSPEADTVPPQMRQRLKRMLDRAGIDEAGQAQVWKSFSQRRSAFRDVMEARRELMREMDEAESEKRLKAYTDANTSYVRDTQRLDKALEEALGLKQKPVLRAQLTGMGLLGISPAPPFGMGMEMRPFRAPGPGAPTAP